MAFKSIVDNNNVAYIKINWSEDWHGFVCGSLGFPTTLNHSTLLLTRHHSMLLEAKSLFMANIFLNTTSGSPLPISLLNCFSTIVCMSRRSIKWGFAESSISSFLTCPSNGIRRSSALLYKLFRKDSWFSFTRGWGIFPSLQNVHPVFETQMNVSSMSAPESFRAICSYGQLETRLWIVPLRIRRPSSTHRFIGCWPSSGQHLGYPGTLVGWCSFEPKLGWFVNISFISSSPKPWVWVPSFP